MSVSDLSPQEWQRYARQIGPGVLSREGQLELRNAAVLIARAGGMGGPAALALAMAGVGRIVLAHGGTLESPDLNRQILGSHRGIGQRRVEQFADYLRSMNEFVTVETVDHEPDDAEANRLAQQVDMVLSCAPTFAERLRLNSAALAAGVPLLDAAQWGITGTLIAVDPGRTACLRCLYPSDPPFEEHFPVVGAISSAVGSLAALEAIKILSHTGRPLFGRLWMIDGFQGSVSIIELTRRDDCPVCGHRHVSGTRRVP